ncbi:MAG TPA: EAL domain-containing protein [Acidimicrobiales bacterium]|nr:EAL domain-containing protein [Acidimicrobiales bacterium]
MTKVDGVGTRIEREAWRGFLALGALVSLAYFLVPPVSGALLYEAIGMAAMTAVIVGVRLHEPRSSTPWLLLAIALGLLTLGDSIFNAHELVFDNDPFPSLADVAYLGAYPFLCAAGVLLVRRRLPGQDAGSFVDAAMLGVGAAVASWVFLMEPYAQDHGLRLVEQVVSIAYPAADLVLVVVIARLVLAPGTRSPSHQLLFAGLLLTLLVDTAFAWEELQGTFLSVEVIDVGFLVAYLLVGAAALHPSMADAERRVQPTRHEPGVWRVGLLGIAALVPTAFLVAEIVQDSLDHGLAIVIGSIALVVLGMVRVGLLMRELARTANLDPLTSLPNRTMLFECIAEANRRALRDGTSLAVLYVDLDRFKLVNDAHGHAAGDELLLQVSERLRSAIRHGDTVARVGGDEFVVLCEGLHGPTAALSAADRLSLSLVERFVLRGATFHVAASIGVAVGSGLDEPDVLLNDADAAMYKAKERGRGRAELFDPSMRQQGAAGTTRLDGDLACAIEREQLRLYFLPQIELASGSLVGVEALLRWQHPEWGTLPPATTVPIAEETGLIVPVGAWVLDEALRQARSWHDGGLPLEITVNVSHLQLVDPGAVDTVLAALTRRQVPAGSLVLDLRAPDLAAADPRAIDTLAELRRHGVHVSIDDFGPEGSRLDVLRKLPADRLKLDRSLVAGVADSDAERAIVAAVVRLGLDLGLRVVAEGVETRSQRRELAELGCHDAQGHLWAPPLPPGSVLDQLLGKGPVAARR